MSKDKAKPQPGPDPERLKIKGLSFEEATKRMLAAGKPKPGEIASEAPQGRQASG